MAAAERQACFGLCTGSPSQSRSPCWGRAELLVSLEKPQLVSRHRHRHQVRVCYPCVMQQQHPEALSQARVEGMCQAPSQHWPGWEEEQHGQQQGPHLPNTQSAAPCSRGVPGPHPTVGKHPHVLTWI